MRTPSTSTAQLCGILFSLLVGGPWSPAPAAAAEPVLAEPISALEQPAIEVAEARWSPDSAHLVHRVNLDFDGTWELHGVAAVSGVRTVLATGLADPTFKISADSQRVIYAAEDGAESLLSVPITGGPAVELGGPGSIAPNFELTPDGQVVYLDGLDIFVVDDEGGTPLQLSQEMLGLWRALEPKLSPDGQRVIYARSWNGARELYSVPVSGGVPVQLGESYPFPEEILSFDITADGATVVFRVGRPQLPSDSRVLSTPIAGGSTATLCSGSTASYHLSDDGQTAVIKQWTQGTSNRVYSIAVGGGAQTQLFDSSEFLTDQFAIPLAIDRALFRDVDLFSVPLGGGDATLLSPILPGIGYVRDFAVTADGQTAIYSADGVVGGRVDLYRVPSTGGPETQLTDPLVDAGSVDDFVLAGDRIFFHRAGRTGFVELDGLPDTILSPPVVVDGAIDELLPVPSGQRLAYRATQRSTHAQELFDVATTGGETVRLSQDPRQRAGEVASFQLSPNGDFAVYLADQETRGLQELYSTRLSDGLGSKLVDSLDDPAHRIFDIQVAQPIGQNPRALYRIDRGPVDGDELWSAPLFVEAETSEAGTPPLRLGETDVEAYALTGGGAAVIYLRGGDLLRQPISGGVPVTLDAEADEILSFRISPDGSRLLYTVPAAIFDQSLRAIPIAGGAPTVLVEEASIADYVISPDSSRVLVTTREAHSEDLYSVPVAGGELTLLDSISLSPVPQFTVDSQRIIYRVNFGLYSVPATGGERVLLSPGTSDSVYGLVVTSENRVIFGLGFVDDRFAVVSNLVTGGPPTFIKQVDTESEEIEDFHVSPDGHRIVYRVASESGARLFSSPVSGGGEIALRGGDDATILSLTNELIFYLPESDLSRLLSESLIGSAPVALVPGDFSAGDFPVTVQPDLVFNPVGNSVFFRAQMHERLTELFASSLDAYLFIDGFETGDLSAWSTAMP